MAKPILFEPVESPWLVPFDESFKIKKAPTEPPDNPGKAANAEALEAAVGKVAKLQEKLYADDRYSVLLVFQAMDAAGKDGTIKAVLTGLNPQGVQVFSFKAPSSDELDHDFLWRVYRCHPERGRIGVWNRSHYEETLVVRIHPNFLGGQRLPRQPEDLWEERFESINAMEKHWARNGCVILKFFLNVSQKEQHKRFLDRTTDAEDHWKFNSGDLAESKLWDQYMEAYEETLRATSKPWAPWYAIPADSKSFMRRSVAEIVHETLRQLPLRYPEPNEKEMAALSAARTELAAELGKTK